MTRPAVSRRREAWSFRVLVPAVAAGIVVLLGLGDYLALDRRLGHVEVSPSTGVAAETWVVVGSDSRADLPSGANVYGTSAEVPGERADVVLVVRRQAGRTTILSLPRDVLVRPSPQTLVRLAVTLQQPQMLVDSLCHTFGIPTNHLVVVHMDGFAAIVDALGGVVVTVPHPVADDYSGLDLTRAGTQRLTGEQALALVRSRHPRELVDGSWVDLTTDAGALQRTQWAATVFRTLLSQVGTAARNPFRAQRLAWATSGALSIDPGTSLADLLRMWPSDPEVTDVPVDQLSGTYVAVTTTATQDALSAAGFAPGTCR